MFQPPDTSTTETTTRNTNPLFSPENLIIGLSDPQTKYDAHTLLQQCLQDGYTFCTTVLPSTSDKPRSDVTVMNNSTWQTSVVGILEEEEDWDMPLEWAWHMGLPVVILPPLPPTLSTSTSRITVPTKQEDGAGAGDANDGVAMDVLPDNGSDSNNNNNYAFDCTQHSILLVEYARKLGQAAMRAKSVNGNIWIPLALPNTMAEAEQAIKQWSTLNRYLKHPSNIGILLDMKPSPISLPSSPPAWIKLQLVFLHHLIGEGSVRAMRFLCSDFLTNRTGYPTLSRGIQYALRFLLQRLGGRLRILVQGPPSHLLTDAKQGTGTVQSGTTKCLPYFQYLQHYRSQRMEIRTVLDTEQARLEEDHCDRLQRPLQPLRDHLSNDTYHVFEKDPVKYKKYQIAISMAMEDFVVAANNVNINSKMNDGSASSTMMVILVVGAGRGPLISCVMKAYELLPPNARPSSLSVWAVEKNPSAILYLRSSSLLTRQEQHCSMPQLSSNVVVRLVPCDLRDLRCETDLQNQKADLVVSELLGSFGDNELSPECLDDLFTKTDVCHKGTISIPQQYTAYLAPAASIKLHQEVTEQALFPSESEGARGIHSEGNGVTGMQVATETPYVVRPRSASQMAPAAECWTFRHPNRNENGCLAMANNLNQRAILQFEGGRRVSESVFFGCGYGPTDGKVTTLLLEEKKAKAGASVGNTFHDGGGGINNSCHCQSLSWTLTGFLGTFSAILYSRAPENTLSANHDLAITISIVPDHFSVGMFSWFPLYFPLERPLSVPASDSVVVRANISRHSVAKEKRVWYEWSAVVEDKTSGQIYGSTAIHNPRGRSFFVSGL